MSGHNKANDQRITALEKSEWLSALRARRYIQGRDRLGSTREGLCCLGVFCVVNGIRFNKASGGESDGPQRLMDALPHDTRSTLAWMNDSGKSFISIADWIERNVAARDEIGTGFAYFRARTLSALQVTK